MNIRTSSSAASPLRSRPLGRKPGAIVRRIGGALTGNNRNSSPTGLRFRERGLFAGTQLGKTECAAYEVACHLTGEYPPDWPGRKFTQPIKAWAVGDNLKMTRDIMQKKLCGEPGDVAAFGSGMIPKHLFVGDPTLARGEGNAFDTVQVRHKSGGTSTLRFRTYQAGRMALQGETLNLVWADEEPEQIRGL